jgi:uncharacterized protein (TIGR03000 family)
MYSVVLMMAMTSGGDLPDLGHRHGCCGGGEYSSCCGGYYGGYSSCCGGYAGYSSCCGGNYGGYSSCCGGESSCCGGGRHHLFGGHRHRGSSCCGGNYGGYSSCCGGNYGGYSSCCGGWSNCTGGMMYAPAYGAPGSVIIEDKGGKPVEGTKPEEIKTKPTDKPKEGALVPAPATIIVSLPADAKLTIDDAATISTSAVRVFTSPTLPVGQEFHYTLKAEFVRDGKPVVDSKEVTVRAGEETRVNMAGVNGVASR